MSYDNLDEFPTLRLPIKGKTYVIDSPSAKTGLWIQSVMVVRSAIAAGERVEAEDVSPILNDDEEADLHKRALGPVYDELAADGIPWHIIQKAGTTAAVWIAFGDAAAERFWNRPATAPKAPARKKK